MQTIAYGPSPDQVGDLYLPAAATDAPTVCLLHGGFWRMPWARDHIVPLAEALSRRGFAVWSLEYRRVGQAGGGWPGTLQDIRAGIEHVAALNRHGLARGAEDVVVVGHSAGGQLALWSAAPAQRGMVRISGAVGLAPVADLVRAFDMDCGKGAVRNFLGATPVEQPSRYLSASPQSLLPLGVPQLIIHGTEDVDVPVDLSRRYVAAAQAAGDPVTWLELPQASHMELIDPQGPAFPSLCEWLSERRKPCS
jgi:acetyl esterase/lipase